MILDNIWYVAAIWMGLAFVASLIAIRTGISVALVEIVVGVIVGNIAFAGGHHILKTTEWTNFLAMLGSGVLTFLAGAEIDPASLRANLRASLRSAFFRFCCRLEQSGCSRSMSSVGRSIRRKSPELPFPPLRSPSSTP